MILPATRCRSTTDDPHLDVIFIDELDPTMLPLQAKGVGELGLTRVAAAVANAVYNATGVRVREAPDYPQQVPRRIASRNVNGSTTGISP